MKVILKNNAKVDFDVNEIQALQFKNNYEAMTFHNISKHMNIEEKEYAGWLKNLMTEMNKKINDPNKHEGKDKASHVYFCAERILQYLTEPTEETEQQEPPN